MLLLITRDAERIQTGGGQPHGGDEPEALKQNTKESHMTYTFTVYTLTPRGSFSQKYEGTDEEAATKAYNKLEAKNLPRCLNRGERDRFGAALFTRMKDSAGFPK